MMAVIAMPKGDGPKKLIKRMAPLQELGDVAQ
jgi:hypothetical protein